MKTYQPATLVELGAADALVLGLSSYRDDNPDVGGKQPMSGGDED